MGAAERNAGRSGAGVARGGIDGLRTPYPLATLLPAFLQEDALLTRMTAALDEVLAPVVSVLDCLEAYVDPLVAPPDFVAWLAEWVGAPLDERWSERRRRASVLAGAALHRLRGTPEGVRALVALATGGEVEVIDSGGVGWARAPRGEAGAVMPHLHVRVLVPDASGVRLAELHELVSAAKPAHVPHTIEVVQR